VQDEVNAGAKAFASTNKGRYECGGYIYSGEGQDNGQFWAKLAVGNATLKKTSSNASITDGNGLYSIAGATYGVYSDKDCTKQLATLTTDNSGNSDTVEVKAGRSEERRVGKERRAGGAAHGHSKEKRERRRQACRGPAERKT